MTYVIHGYGKNGTLLNNSVVMDAVRVALVRAVDRDGRLHVTFGHPVFMPRSRHLPDGWQLRVERVSGTRRDLSILHEIVNDVLDRLEVTADVWMRVSYPLTSGTRLWIRKNGRRRIRYDVRAQVRGGVSKPIEVANAGSEDQFDVSKPAARVGRIVVDNSPAKRCA